MFERLDTICLQVSDVEKSSIWYQEILGLKEIFKADGYRILSIGNSGLPLTIEEGQISLNGKSAYPILFSKDINQVYERLKEQGVTVSELYRDGVNNFFNLFDPDNNKLQVCFWE